MDYLSLCLICKDENEYLPEWLDYHIVMGVDRFYIYDNESRVSLRETLKDYIERGWVVVVDIPGKAMQLHAYDHCLHVFGAQTFWLGFIDTDEFLVPKPTLDLKELLRDYEQYAGLAISSLYFGSSGHKNRPAIGQLAAYTNRIHAANKEFELVKSIVQPRMTLMPNSPHDFTIQAGAWCVNEGYLRVDYQRFPSHTDKIQLNHYFCRSMGELDQKLMRGNSGDISWSRQRFEVVDKMATYKDTKVLDNLAQIFKKTGLGRVDQNSTSLLENIKALALARYSAPGEEIPLEREANCFRTEFTEMDALKTQARIAENNRDLNEVKRLLLLIQQKVPQNIILYLHLSVVFLDLGDASAAWEALSQAWKISSNNYAILGGMVYYFLRVTNFSMAEKTCHLLLELMPHDTVTLGLLTNSLIGQGRYEEALKVGVPVVELAAQFGELPNRMGVSLAKQLADYLIEKKDYDGAARMWEAGVKCQPEDVIALLELTKCLILAGDKPGAHQRLVEAQVLAPQNEVVLELLRTDALATRPAENAVRSVRVKRRR